MMFLRVIAGKTVIFARDLIRIATTPVRSKDENVMRKASMICRSSLSLWRRFSSARGALDCDARKMGNLFDEFIMLRTRVSRLASVDCAGSQHAALRGEYRRRPTRPQPVR